MKLSISMALRIQNLHTHAEMIMEHPKLTMVNYSSSLLHLWLSSIVV